MPTSDEIRFKNCMVKNEIEDVYNRYCKGVDQPDLDLIKSAYWEDALDDHIVFRGNAYEFAELAVETLKKYRRSQHFWSNLSITLSDDNHVDAECYYWVYHELPPSDADGSIVVTRSGGRYIDRFQRRNGEWRVLSRKVTMDWEERYQAANPTAPLTGAG